VSKARGNGDPGEMLDEQQQRQLEAQNAQAAHAREEFSRDLADYVDSVTETEVNPIEKCGLENFLSKDFVLGYQDAKDIEAQRWYMYIVIERILAVAPQEGDFIKGDEEMELMYGVDANKTITEPLSVHDKNALHAARMVIVSRASRSKDGFQQETFKTNVSESRVVRPEQDSGGGLMSYLRRG